MSQKQENPEKYNCDQVERLAQKYVDNQLSDIERKLFDEHLEYCLPCDKKIQLEFKLKEIVRIKAHANLDNTFTKDRIRNLFDNLH